MAKIGIIGCGWLGKPLAKVLDIKHQVECFSRKTQEDNDLSYVLNPPSEDTFWEQDIFIFSISTRDNYLQTLHDLISNCSQSASIILMSSTSVYKEHDALVDEKTIIKEKSLQKQAEELVLSLRDSVLILRLGGLMGDDRISGKWKSTSAFTDGPVNYIHKDDVIAIVIKMIDKNIVNGIYNLVSPEHPFRSLVHIKNSKDLGFDLGDFEGKTQRIVSSDKLLKTLDYTFLHPDPLEFWT